MNEIEIYPVERWSDVADALCGCRVTVGRSGHELKRLPLEFSPLEFSFDYSPHGLIPLSEWGARIEAVEESVKRREMCERAWGGTW